MSVRIRSFLLTQVIVRSFLLKEKNQKFKAASAELLRLFVTLCAPQTRFAQTATLRPLHSVPPLNAHQNEANSIDNFLFFLIYPWHSLFDWGRNRLKTWILLHRVYVNPSPLRGAPLKQGSFLEQPKNFPCRRGSARRAMGSFPKLNGELNTPSN